MITTRFFIDGADLADVHAVRRQVFIEEQGIDEADEMDGTDPECIHLAAYDDAGTAVATGRIRVTRDEFSIGRVAVLKEHRGRQYGQFIMQVLIHACFAMGGERQVVHAQLSARAFYERLGFTAYGEVYDDAGIPHINMERFGDSAVFCADAQTGKE